MFPYRRLRSLLRVRMEGRSHGIYSDPAISGYAGNREGKLGGGETAGIRLRYNSLTNTANRADGRVSKTYLFYLSLRHVSAIFDHKINE